MELAGEAMGVFVATAVLAILRKMSEPLIVHARDALAALRARWQHPAVE